MPEHSRIDDLRRRVQKDPASIAFAQLAEEYRRAGRYEESVDVCRAGLELHPTYLSARVTLGRALLELARLDEARSELQAVLRAAPENLAAIRAVAESHHRQGTVVEALDWFRAALALAPNDPELEQMVDDLSRKLGPAARGDQPDALSLDQLRRDLQGSIAGGQQPPQSPLIDAAPAAPELVTRDERGADDNDATVAFPAFNPDQERADAERMIGALEHWLEAIHGARAYRGA